MNGLSQLMNGLSQLMNGLSQLMNGLSQLMNGLSIKFKNILYYFQAENNNNFLDIKIIALCCSVCALPLRRMHVHWNMECHCSIILKEIEAIKKL